MNIFKKTIIITATVIILLAALFWELSVVNRPRGRVLQTPEMPAGTSTPVSNQRACEDALTTELQTDSGTIATNTILVAFVPATSFGQAEAILATVGASATPAVTSDDFSVNHIIQAAVSSDTEISAICTLRANSAVHYASFDRLFFLHP